MKTILAKILLFIMIINGTLSSFTFNAFAKNKPINTLIKELYIYFIVMSTILTFLILKGYYSQIFSLFFVYSYYI